MNKTKASDETGAEELEDFEKHLESKFHPVLPNIYFKSALKDKLAQSNIYQKRKETASWWALWLGVSLLGVILVEIGILIHRNRLRRGGN
ncbi:MAG: hypothetical protein WA116_06750 [Anaerolineaceae bacterium]